MTTDLVVVVPGVTGSSLTDADDREVWGLGAGSLLRALATLGGSLRRLTLEAGFGEGPALDGVAPSELIMGFHGIPGVWTPVVGYGALVQFLAQRRFGLTLERPEEADAPPGNLVLFAYDWRLSNRWTAKLLQCRVERALTRWRESAPERADARVVFICHSMGGLVARWYLDVGKGAEVARALVTLGTPHRGALSALEQLVNGVRKGWGPLKLDLTRFAQSLPSSYELLPEYACVERSSEDAQTVLVKTTECELPGLSRDAVNAGMSFHDELDGAAPGPYPLLPIVGIGQPTATTAQILDGRVRPLRTIAGRDLAGDGTVPRLAARPKRLGERDPALRGVGEGHGALVARRSVLDQLDFLLSAEDTVYRAASPSGEEATEEQVLGVSVAPLHEAGESVEVVVCAAERRLLEVVAVGESGRALAREPVRFGAGVDGAGRSDGAATFERLPPGGYTLLVQAPQDPHGVEVQPVRATTLVWEGEG